MMDSNIEYTGPETAEWIGALRDNCRAQRDVWQRVPWLALQAADPSEEVVAAELGGAWMAVDANGPGYTQERLGLAFLEGYWPLGVDEQGLMVTAYVDCATGEIVDAEDPSKPARDSVVATLIDTPDDVNATTIVARLQRGVSGPNSDAHAEWRRAMAKDTGLSPHRRFTRSVVPERGFE